MMDRIETGFDEATRRLLDLPLAGAEPSGCTHTGAAPTEPWWEPLRRRWRRAWRCPACRHSWQETLPAAPAIRTERC